MKVKYCFPASTPDPTLSEYWIFTLGKESNTEIVFYDISYKHESMSEPLPVGSVNYLRQGSCSLTLHNGLVLDDIRELIRYSEYLKTEVSLTLS